MSSTTPPRLSEDRLNLPQPHSPSLPTHCTAPGNRECAHPELDGVTPWEIRNILPEIYDPLVAQMRELAAPILAEFGDTPRTRILLDRFRDDCIRGVRGEG